MVENTDYLDRHLSAYHYDNASMARFIIRNQARIQVIIPYKSLGSWKRFEELVTRAFIIKNQQSCGSKGSLCI